LISRDSFFLPYRHFRTCVIYLIIDFEPSCRLKPYPSPQVAAHICGDNTHLFPNTSCPTVKSVARPVQIRQKMATPSPKLTSGMRRRESLPSIRKKFNVSSLFLVGICLFVVLRSHEHVVLGLIMIACRASCARAADSCLPTAS
jgi:hypothetical protein